MHTKTFKVVLICVAVLSGLLMVLAGFLLYFHVIGIEALPALIVPLGGFITSLVGAFSGNKSKCNHCNHHSEKFYCTGSLLGDGDKRSSDKKRDQNTSRSASPESNDKRVK